MLAMRYVGFDYSRLMAGIGVVLALAFTPVFAGIIDADSDNMDDVFEAANRLNPAIDDALDDLDADGFSNLAEYRLGSDPDDALSLPPELGTYFESFETAAPSFWFSPGNPDWYDWLWTPDEASAGAASLYTTIEWDDFASGAADGEEVIIALVVNAANSFLSVDFLQPNCNVDVTHDNPYTPVQHALGEFEIRINGEVRHQQENCVSRNWTPIAQIPVMAGEQRIEFVYRGKGTDGWREPPPYFDDTVFLDDLQIELANPANTTDTDDDGVSNYDEAFVHGTDLRERDTDNDQMPDGYEVAEGTNPLVNDGHADFDGDGFSNRAEYFAGSSAGDSTSLVPLSAATTETFEAFASGLPSPWFVVGNPAETWWKDNSNKGWQWRAAADLSFSIPGSGALVYEDFGPSIVGYVANVAQPSIVTVTVRRKQVGNSATCEIYPRTFGIPWRSSPMSRPDSVEEGSYTLEGYLNKGVHELPFSLTKGYSSGEPLSCDGVPVIESLVVSPDTSTDSDNDGVSDIYESFHGTLPDNPDSDDDGLLDGAEVNQYGTNPLIANSDGDEFDDGEEVDLGLNPALPYDSLLDADGDQYLNFIELAYDSDLNDPISIPSIPAFVDGSIISFETTADLAPWLASVDGAKVAIADSVGSSRTYPAYHDANRLRLAPGAKFRLYLNARANTLMDFHLFRQPQRGARLEVRQIYPSLYYQQAQLYKESSGVSSIGSSSWVQIESLRLQPGPNIIEFSIYCSAPGYVLCGNVYIDYIHFKLDPNRAVPAPAVVSIDIDPASSSNLIDLDVEQSVAIAMLSTSIANGDSVDFDATTVSGSSVRFGPAQAQSPYPAGLYADVDSDGDTDMLLAFPPAAAGFQCDQAGNAELTGMTVYGQEFSGTDAFLTSQCEDSGCHP